MSFTFSMTSTTPSTTTSTTTSTPRTSLDLEDGLWYESDGSVGPLQLPDDLSPPGLLGVHHDDSGDDAVNPGWEEPDTDPGLQSHSSFLNRPTLFNWQSLSGSWLASPHPPRYLLKQMVYESELNNLNTGSN